MVPPPPSADNKNYDPRGEMLKWESAFYQADKNYIYILKNDIIFKKYLLKNVHIFRKLL